MTPSKPGHGSLNSTIDKTKVDGLSGMPFFSINSNQSSGTQNQTNDVQGILQFICVAVEVQHLIFKSYFPPFLIARSGSCVLPRAIRPLNRFSRNLLSSRALAFSSKARLYSAKRRACSWRAFDLASRNFYLVSRAVDLASKRRALVSKSYMNCRMLFMSLGRVDRNAGHC